MVRPQFESNLNFNTNLSASGGVAWVNENFDQDPDNHYPAGNWIVNYDQFVFNKFMQLFHNQTGYVSLENSNDWFLRTRTGVRFPIYKGFTATVQYDYDYTNNPSVAAESKGDRRFLLLLGYQYAD